MRRKGQIFLLMTILSITFIFAISSVLLEIQRAQYLEPSPDMDKTFEVWNNAVFSIEQILSVQIASNTQTGSLSGNNSIQISAQLASLESYLLSRGLIASVDLIGTAQYTAPAIGGQIAIATIVSSIYLQLESSSGNSITQTLDFTISYSGNAPAGGNTLFLSKSVNGKITYITGATFDTPGTVDNGNGSYDFPVGAYVITTPDNVRLEITSI